MKLITKKKTNTPLGQLGRCQFQCVQHALSSPEGIVDRLSQLPSPPWLWSTQGSCALWWWWWWWRWCGDGGATAAAAAAAQALPLFLISCGERLLLLAEGLGVELVFLECSLDFGVRERGELRAVLCNQTGHSYCFSFLNNVCMPRMDAAPAPHSSS